MLEWLMLDSKLSSTFVFVFVLDKMMLETLSLVRGRYFRGKTLRLLDEHLAKNEPDYSRARERGREHLF